MTVLTSKSGGSGPRSPEGKERFENEELYRKRVDVEKFSHSSYANKINDLTCG
jgi:hypothetical protein